MKKQNEAELQESRKKIQKVFEEEEAVSQTFKLNNFYSNHRLNLPQLKQRLEQFKRNHQTPLPPQASQQTTYQPSTKEFSSEQVPTNFRGTFAGDTPLIKQKITLPTAHRHRLTHYDDGSTYNETFNKKIITPEKDVVSRQRIEEVRQANYRIVKQVKRYDGKTRTANGVRQRSAGNKQNYSHNGRGQSLYERRKGQEMNSSKCSKVSNKISSVTITWALEGRLVIQTKTQLVEFQKQITTLWSHYQLLTKILVSLKEGSPNEKNVIVKFVEDVCTDKFEFVRDLLTAVSREGAQRNQYLFVKRLRRSIILSRLLENMAIVYVGLGICMQREPEAHLVNFVGYCCSNVTFLIRLTYLLHSMEDEMRLSAPVAHIMGVISEFQQDSYKQAIERISDVVLRMQHNNQIIGIVQNRLCNSMDKQFQKIISTFLKNVDLDSKPLYEYSHYIYQFLAFHLAVKNIVGKCSFLEMAPSPYLDPLPKQKTLVIEPWEVLVALKGSTTYIRSYTDTFLKQIANYWNIVYWTDLMPDPVDDLLQKLPPGKVLYRYHCRYENDRYLKLLWRLGLDIDNTIIVDRDEANFKYDKDMGIALPWNGRKKDSKLLELLNALHNFMLQDTPLKKIFRIVKQQLTNKKKQGRAYRISQPKEETDNSLPRAVSRARKNSRLQDYQY